MEGVHKQKQSGRLNGWRAGIATVFIIFGGILMMLGIVAHYLNDKALNTDGYLSIVSDLPKNPAVATALGTFTVERIFDNVDADNLVNQFLPDNLQTLTPALTSQLREFLGQSATTFASSNAFQSVWVSANRLAHTALLAVADGKVDKAVQQNVPANAIINLEGLLQGARSYFGTSNEAVLTDQQRDNLAEIRVDLQQSSERLQATASWIRLGSWLFPLLAFILFVLAIFIANNRFYALLGVGIAIVVSGVAVIIAAQVVSDHYLGTIEREVYRNAAAAVYEAFYGGLRSRLIAAIILGGLVSTTALFFGPFAWAVSLRRKIGWDKGAHAASHHHRSHR